MKNPLTLFLLASVLVLAVWLVPLGAQSNLNDGDQLLPLAQVIAEQQKQIAENQTQIEKSVAAVQENLRQAKIYVSRSGKAGGTK